MCFFGKRQVTLNAEKQTLSPSKPLPETTKKIANWIAKDEIIHSSSTIKDLGAFLY